MRKIRRVATLGAMAGALVAALLVPPALSTPGSGVTSSLVARGQTDTKIRSHAKKYDVLVQNLSFAVGGYSGWHSHPGQVIVIVRSGTLTTYNVVESDDDDDDGEDADEIACKKSVYEAGQVYVDPGRGKVHMVRNEGTTTLEVTATYLDVPINGGVFRNDEAAQVGKGCPA